MPPEPTPPATVVVVEDDEHLAEMYAEWLADRHDVRIANTGKEALDAFDPAVDVVLLDRLLPDQQGSDVLGELRQRPGDCWVAMVTAVEPSMEVVEMGFDEYLTKPVDEVTLRETVTRLRRRATYNELLRELYALASKKGALEAHYSQDELRGSPEYTELRRRLDELHDRIDDTIDEFDDEEFVGLLRDADTVVP